MSTYQNINLNINELPSVIINLISNFLNPIEFCPNCPSVEKAKKKNGKYMSKCRPCLNSINKSRKKRKIEEKPKEEKNDIKSNVDKEMETAELIEFKQKYKEREAYISLLCLKNQELQKENQELQQLNQELSDELLKKPKNFCVYACNDELCLCLANPCRNVLRYYDCFEKSKGKIKCNVCGKNSILPNASKPAFSYKGYCRSDFNICNECFPKQHKLWISSTGLNPKKCFYCFFTQTKEESCGHPKFT